MNIKRLIKGEITLQDLLNYYDANISYLKLPKNIDGFVFGYKGLNNIIINNNLSVKRKKDTIIHELAHIELNHLCQKNKLFEFCFIFYEDEADDYIKFLKEIE